MRWCLSLRDRRGEARKQQRADRLVEYQTWWQSQILRDFARLTGTIDQFLTKPIRRAQKLTSKNVGLNLFSLSRRVPFDATCARVDWITAQPWAHRRHLISRVKVQMVVTDLMRDNEDLIRWILAAYDIDDHSLSIKKAENAVTDD